jgi:hypothetical protein
MPPLQANDQARGDAHMNDVGEHGQLAEDARKTRQGPHALQPLIISLKKLLRIRLDCV